MMSRQRFWIECALALVLAGAAWQLRPQATASLGVDLPATLPETFAENDSEPPCPNEHPEWRAAQEIEGVAIDAASECEPDNPYDIAVAVKGVDRVSMHTLMQTQFAQDALTFGEDLDGDGDPDVVHLKLEVVELNGASPDGSYVIPGYRIAPGIQPGIWVFAPKSRDMALKNFRSTDATAMLRAPSPTIRVEQGDKVYITLENTHYLPHSIHLHGVDHPWRTANGEDNDGDGDMPVYPGESKTYEIQPRHAGTMLYHCHVQTDKHLQMGMSGLFVVEENRPNNWLQTFNIGAGLVRHPSVAVRERYQREYDLLFQSLDKQLSRIIQHSNDPRVIAERMNRDYNITESAEHYYLLNGHAYPYTLRDAQLVVNSDEAVKLRVGNMQNAPLALHLHGHKVTATAQDGVELPSALQVPRDVFDLATAQRADLLLSTVNDGLHSYGPGLWMFHDHVDRAVTTDGITPGGNMSFVAYQALLNEQGMPKDEHHAQMIHYAFSKSYYDRNAQHSLWAKGEFSEVLGKVAPIAPNYLQLMGFGLSLGAALGLLLHALLRGLMQREEGQ